MNEISVNGYYRPRAGATVSLNRTGWKYPSAGTPDEARQLAQRLIEAADAAEDADPEMKAYRAARSADFTEVVV